MVTSSGSVIQERSKRPRRPMKRPVATITGMIGTKTSPKVRIARWNQFPCLAASAFISSLEDVGKQVQPLRRTSCLLYQSQR